MTVRPRIRAGGERFFAVSAAVRAAGERCGRLPRRGRSSDLAMRDA